MLINRPNVPRLFYPEVEPFGIRTKKNSIKQTQKSAPVRISKPLMYAKFFFKLTTYRKRPFYPTLSPSKHIDKHVDADDTVWCTFFQQTRKLAHTFLPPARLRHSPRNDYNDDNHARRRRRRRCRLSTWLPVLCFLTRCTSSSSILISNKRLCMEPSPIYSERQHKHTNNGP